MTTKNNFWIAVSIIMLGAIAALIYWMSNDKGSNMTIEDKRAKCLSQPAKDIPSKMPQRKSYDENFSHLFYNFPSWWMPQLGSIQSISMPDANTIYEKILVNGENVWFTYSPDSSIARYDTQTNKLKLYSIPDKRNQPFKVLDIYLTHNETLWATLNSPQPGGGYSILARYRPDKDEFEIITDQDGMFAHLQETWGNPSDKKIAEMLDGQLAVVMEGNIYLYNPATNRAQLLLDSGNIESIAAGKGNRIWYVNHYKDFNIRAVDAETRKIVDYGIPPNLGKQFEAQPELLEATKAISIDQQGRVWVSYFDRLEPDKNGQYSWHSVKLPSVFVNTFDPYYAYRWADVFSTHVFSDGNVWFVSDIGIVKYDVQNEIWCLSAEVKTFVNYPITEDANGNIWTVIDNQIYKLQN